MFRLFEFDLIGRAGIEPALEAEPLPAHIWSRGHLDAHHDRHVFVSLERSLVKREGGGQGGEGDR